MKIKDKPKKLYWIRHPDTSDGFGIFPSKFHAKRGMKFFNDMRIKQGNSPRFYRLEEHEPKLCKYCEEWTTEDDIEQFGMCLKCEERMWDAWQDVKGEMDAGQREDEEYY